MNASVVRDEGSFRDPSGYIFQQDDRILRAVTPYADEKFRRIYDSGLLKRLSDQGLMIPTQRIDVSNIHTDLIKGARQESLSGFYEHPRIPFISYPYEWTFSQLKDAALLHLQLQMTALEEGFTLSDATAFNIQFQKTKPVHIDVLSLQAYQEGETWSGYNQFCRQFLLPLLVESWAGLRFQPMLRGSLQGISFEDALSVIPRHKYLTNLSGMIHVYLHGKSVIRRSSSETISSSTHTKIPKSRYHSILEQLYDFIKGLKSSTRSASYWKEYAQKNSYSVSMHNTKLEFVRTWASNSKPGMIWDIGGNSGDFSKVAIEGGAEHAVIMDSDLDSLEWAYQHRTQSGERILPLVMDVTDPSPALGWRQTERKGLMQRKNADGILALAVLHHLCIGNNIPLIEAMDWLLSLAPTGVIEFVPKSDPMVKQLLTLREDIFSDYNESNFKENILKRHDIIFEHRFADNDRLLVSYKLKSNA